VLSVTARPRQAGTLYVRTLWQGQTVGDGGAQSQGVSGV